MNEYQSLMTQRELCNRWQVSEATLERWRSEGIGPIYVKLGGQVRYRREDVQEYEEPYLNGLHFMLNQPEFAHSNQILALLELIEHRKLLLTIIPSKLASHQVQVVIGKENKAEVKLSKDLVMLLRKLLQLLFGIA